MGGRRGRARQVDARAIKAWWGPCRVGVAHVAHGSESVRGAGDRCDINDRAVRSERTMHASFTARGSSWRRYVAQIRIRTRAHARHGGPAAAGARARSRDLGRAPAPAGHGSAVHGIIVVRLPGTVTGSVDPGPAQITCCLWPVWQCQAPVRTCSGRPAGQSYTQKLLPRAMIEPLIGNHKMVDRSYARAVRAGI